eukprot:TRINITY_DN4017_c0_g1_i1.p1 TRINITY_DN4017_c0_g1~~TRINITY_DN4017_c0_g1_i1.p1  ORF type:complete len:453 (+),score=94.83 TRINITY_DN4017_c0_g1_i1:26-1384(+)
MRIEVSSLTLMLLTVALFLALTESKPTGLKLSWAPPTEYVDGRPIENGDIIYSIVYSHERAFGRVLLNYWDTVSYSMDELFEGEYTMGVVARTTVGHRDSALSEVASMNISASDAFYPISLPDTYPQKKFTTDVQVDANCTWYHNAAEVFVEGDLRVYGTVVLMDSVLVVSGNVILAPHSEVVVDELSYLYSDGTITLSETNAVQLVDDYAVVDQTRLMFASGGFINQGNYPFHSTRFESETYDHELKLEELLYIPYQFCNRMNTVYINGKSFCSDPDIAPRPVLDTNTEEFYIVNGTCPGYDSGDLPVSIGPVPPPSPTTATPSPTPSPGATPTPSPTPVPSSTTPSSSTPTSVTPTSTTPTPTSSSSSPTPTVAIPTTATPVPSPSTTPSTPTLTSATPTESTGDVAGDGDAEEPVSIWIWVIVGIVFFVAIAAVALGAFLVGRRRRENP